MSLRIRYTIVFVVLVIAYAAFSYREIRSELEIRYRESVEENMVDHGRMMAHLFSSGLEFEMLDDAMKSLTSDSFDAKIYDYLKTNTRSFIYVTDLNGIVLYHSQDSSQMGVDYSQWRDVNLTLKGQYGARSTRLDPDDDNSSILYVAAPIIRNGKMHGVLTLGKPIEDFREFLNKARNRSFFWISSASFMLILAGVAAGRWVAAPLRRMENDLAARQYIENYVQTLTHELKSPLSAILGATEILENNPDSKTQAHFLENIRSESQRMRDLVHMILEIASMERKQQLENGQLIEWSTIIHSLKKNLSVPIHINNIVIDWPSVQTFKPIYGDSLLLIQAIHNVLLNAIEYSSKGASIQFEIKMRMHSYYVYIRDYGPGIPDYGIKRVGEKFFSLPKPSTGRKGTGLGIAFAQEAIRLHKGSLQIQNHKNPSGVQVTIQLPI